MQFSQACLKEIHTNLLRKHLQRLENPAENDDNLEIEHDESKLQAEEVDTIHDVEGMKLFSF